MRAFAVRLQRTLLPGMAAILPAILLVAAALFPAESQAIPVFARQTGQNCLACHAGGQFPELTAYGRKFKLTGYTMGERAKIPLAVMAVASSARVANTSNGGFDSGTDFPNNGSLEITTASLFCCGKITDNIGLFGQWTYDRYVNHQPDGSWGGQSHADQVDLRFADRFIGVDRDLIYGVSFNNNPGVTDVWNTHNNAFTPVPTYVPNDGNRVVSQGNVPMDVPVTPIIEGLGQSTVGLTAYAFWNNAIYAELGTYKTAQGPFSFLNATGEVSGMGFPTRIKGSNNPYWRLAYNHDWGANSAMIGLHGLEATSYSDPSDLSSPTVKFRDVGVDGQYQYILDPHAITAMFSWTHEKQSYPDELWNPNSVTNPGFATFPQMASNPTDTLNYVRAKLTYVYQAKYGASLAYTSVTGSADSTLYGGSPTGTPDSRLWVPEIFVNPVQYVRVGLQYYKWAQFNGSSSNVTNNTDPTIQNRSAANNNTLFFYVWAAY